MIASVILNQAQKAATMISNAEIYLLAELAETRRELRGYSILSVIERLRSAEKALNKCKEHCLCERNTEGFDYREAHRHLGKPKPGARWLTPWDLITTHFKAVKGE